MLQIKYGFTLSEILIALVVIGVIAAITVPSIMTNLEKQDTIVRLKTAYSIVTQVVNKARVDYGAISSWDVTLSAEEFGKTYVKPYLTYSKECISTSGDCWKTDDFNGYYDLAGNAIKNTISYSLILNNGMILGIHQVSSIHLVSFIVDINGQKKPNKMGRDIFSFYIFNPESTGTNYSLLKNYKGKEGLYIGGYYNGGVPHAFLSRDELLSSSFYRACNKEAKNASSTRPGIGAACAAVIAMDGWQIKSDYPW